MNTRLQSSKQKKRAFRFGGIPIEWQNFIKCLIAESGLVLVPFAVDIFTRASLSDRELALASVVYSFAIAVSMQNGALQLAAFLAALFFFGVGGSMSETPFATVSVATFFGCKGMALVWTVAVLCIHACNRYNKHVVDREEFRLES